MKLKVLVDDNLQFADDSAQTNAGEYATAEGAGLCQEDYRFAPYGAYKIETSANKPI